MNLSVGSLLQGKYKIEARLDGGCFEATYRAKHLRLQRSVLVKTLDDCLRSHPQFEGLQRQFAARARSSAQCVHPHLIRVWDLFEEGGRWFAVLDCLPGSSLAGAIASEGSLDADLALTYIHQAGSALAALHRCGAVHRDVTPERIVVLEDGKTALLDSLGAVWDATSGMAQTQAGLLSAGYAAPELSDPAAEGSVASDIYGLAATLYALLAGHPPVPACLRDRLDVESVREGRPELDPAVERALWRGLAVDPKARPRNLDTWLQLLPAPQSATPPKPRRRTFGRSSEAKRSIPKYVWIPCLFLATSLTAAVGGAGIVLGVRWHQAQQVEPEGFDLEAFPTLNGMPDAPPEPVVEETAEPGRREDDALAEGSGDRWPARNLAGGARDARFRSEPVSAWENANWDNTFETRPPAEARFAPRPTEPAYRPADPVYEPAAPAYEPAPPAYPPESFEPASAAPAPDYSEKFPEPVYNEQPIAEKDSPAFQGEI